MLAGPAPHPGASPPSIRSRPAARRPCLPQLAPLPSLSPLRRAPGPRVRAPARPPAAPARRHRQPWPARAGDGDVDALLADVQASLVDDDGEFAEDDDAWADAGDGGDDGGAGALPDGGGDARPAAKATSPPPPPPPPAQPWGEVEPMDEVEAAAEAEFLEEMRAAGSGSLARGLLADPAIEGDPLKWLAICDAYWSALRSQPPKRGPAVVRERASKKLGAPPSYDVVVAGGTLGLLVAAALQARGLATAVLERRAVAGRDQEWNTTRDELKILVDLGLVTQAELEAATVTDCGPMRIAFCGDRSPPIWLEGALDVGVCPRTLLAAVRARYEAEGGVVKEWTAFKGAEVCANGVVIDTSPSRDAPPDVGDAGRPLAAEAQEGDEEVEEAEDGEEEEAGADADAAPSTKAPRLTAADRKAARAAARAARSARPSKPGEVTCRLLIDCMGHWSPIAKQARPPARPDGVCLVVGTCAASGIPPRPGGDFLASHAPADGDVQWLWETFPAEGGSKATSYMFAYVDADRRRPSLTQALDRYFQDLPAATGARLSELVITRALFGAFPSYAASPLPPAFDRVLPAGDAAGGASPLSFGGFGSMLRRLPGLVRGVDDALAAGHLSKRALAGLQPYQPSLSATWLFARAMRFPPGSLAKPGKAGGWLPADHVNRLLAANFRVARLLGAGALAGLVRERARAASLAACMAGVALAAPVTVVRVLRQVGPRALAAWIRHALALAACALARLLTLPLRRLAFRAARLAPGGRGTGVLAWLRRALDALAAGAGHDGAGGGVRIVDAPPSEGAAA